MDRRGFLCRLTAAGAAGAVGLETMLRGVRGVTEASASYANKTVTIAFDAQTIGEDALKGFISDCGFSVA